MCFTVRAEKEKINEKMKVGEQQEEVDDSGFFAGERLYFPYAMCLQPFLPRASWEELLVTLITLQLA